MTADAEQPRLWHGLTEQEAAEHNAAAWLAMTDEELVRCSSSLGESPHMVCERDAYLTNPDSVVHDPNAHVADDDDLARLRATADKIAADHAGSDFATKWIRENRA